MASLSGQLIMQLDYTESSMDEINIVKDILKNRQKLNDAVFCTTDFLYNFNQDYTQTSSNCPTDSTLDYLYELLEEINDKSKNVKIDGKVVLEDTSWENEDFTVNFHCRNGEIQWLEGPY